MNIFIFAIVTLIILAYVAIMATTITMWINCVREKDLLAFGLALISTFALIFALIIPLTMINNEYKEQTTSKETSIVEVTVTDKSYSPERLSMIPVNGIIVPNTSPEKCILTVEYKGMKSKLKIKDKSSYDMFEIGDTFEMELTRYIQDDGNIYKNELKLIVDD